MPASINSSSSSHEFRPPKINIMKISKQNLLKSLKSLFAYSFLIVGFEYIVFYYSYTVRCVPKPTEWITLLITTSLYYLFYITVNHLLIRRIVKWSVRTINLLLLLTILTLIYSDLKFNYDYPNFYRWQRRETSVTV